VPDLFERWNLDEDPLINPYSELDLREETEKLIGNCLLVKNEILARHGALLSDEWSAFFSQFPWYEPRSNFSEDELNETEKLNLKLIEIYLKHILPNADEESFTAKFQALLDKYGDAFFRHFPVLNREENRETIQKFIEQRLEVWEPYNPLHLGQCEPGYVKSPAALNKIEGTNYENIYLLGQTENGFSIFHATDDKILLEKDGTFYEIYQKIASGNIMYERYYDTPCKNAFLLHLEFHDHEIEDIMKKWCREVKNTVTGTVLNPLDDLLVLPETGEKYVLSGLDIYAINHVWSENGHLFAYPCEISGVPYLQVIDIKNRHLMKYTLPENCITTYDDQVKVFKAFCDEKRLRILELLRSGEKCACVLIEQLDMPQSSLSYHMKILCESGIVDSRPDGKWMYYKISEKGGGEAMALLRELITPNAIAMTDESNCCL
jgi:ArsR family transcriptional regulator